MGKTDILFLAGRNSIGTKTFHILGESLIKYYRNILFSV